MTQEIPLVDYGYKHQKAGGNIRWIICALLFGAIVLIYIQRNVVSVLKDETFTSKLGWTAAQYANTTASFTIAYAVGMLFAGRLLDRMGVRKGFLIAASFWTVIASAHGLLKYVPLHSRLDNFSFVTYLGGTTVAVFCLMRFALGSFEGAFFPASIRTVADWFPKHERALATGIFNAGSAVGALLSPLMVPWIADHWGWPMAFYIAGGLGIPWVLIWLLFYRDPEHHPLITPSEMTYIRSDQERQVKSLPWAQVFDRRQTICFAIGKFMTDPIWWFYIFWLPGILHEQFGVDFHHFGLPLVIVYIMADLGSIAGGWLSSHLMHRGWSVNAARKTAMLTCALLVLPVLSVSYLHSLGLAIGIIGVAAAAHQGWSANMFTLASDTAPRSAVGSIVGIGGMAGAIGSFIFQKTIGYFAGGGTGVHKGGSGYLIPFIVSGSAYLLALLVIHLINPRLESMKLQDEGPFTIES